MHLKCIILWTLVRVFTPQRASAELLSLDTNATNATDFLQLDFLESDLSKDSGQFLLVKRHTDDDVGNETVANDTDHTSEEEYLDQIRSFIFPKTWTWVLISFHFIVFTVGLVGNTLVCVSVYRNHSMRTVTNYFIVNLAVADFLVILLCLPPSVIWDVTLTWFFGIAMCKIVLYLQTVSVTVSVLTLTFISVDRWYAICFPLKFKSTTGRAKTAIGLIWLVALSFDIPELVVYQTETNKEIPINTIFFTQCVPAWSKEVDRFWTCLKMFLLYIVPLAFMTITYYQIIRVLWKSGNVSHQSLGIPGRQNTFSCTNTNIESQLRSRKKAAKMLVAVVVMFAFCYFPVHLLSLLRLCMELTNNEPTIAFALISHWLCYANSAVNPVIYNFMSGKFRKEFKRAIDCCSSTSNRSAYEMNSFYYKNTVKETSLSLRKSGGGARSSAGGGSGGCSDIRRMNNAEAEFITTRRGTRTSVIKIDV